jgi:hypothetical protein
MSEPSSTPASAQPTGDPATAYPAEAPAIGPFDATTLPHFDLSQVRDELDVAQADPEAARALAAKHWSRLLYDPNYPWRGQTPYPQMPAPRK